MTLFALLLTANVYSDENIDQAWLAFDKDDFITARSHINKSLESKRNKALSDQAEITGYKSQNKEIFIAFSFQSINDDKDAELPGAKEIVKNQDLNDVATASFIEAEILIKEGKKEEAKKLYKEIVDLFPDAYCYDPKGWYWNVSAIAQDKIDTMDTKYDYGDYKSETLTSKSWKALKDKDLRGMDLYAKKCIKLYKKDAYTMLDDKSKLSSEGQEAQNWALNDVATCYYILGEKALEESNDTEAKNMFSEAAKLGLGSCWDPRGWYWNVANVSQDKLDTMGTSYDYGDYRSVTLVTKAWKSLSGNDFKGVELYTKKCIFLYEQRAREMQGTLSDFAKSGLTAYYWALNDVATCYFILGESYNKQGQLTKAKNAYQSVVDTYEFGQCWDPRGWYWKVSKVAKSRLSSIK